jgi:O-antigen/teichoic acid export membrane protein
MGVMGAISFAHSPAALRFRRPGRLAAAAAAALLGSAFARDAAVVMVGTGVGQALNLASSPVLTRLYAPEQIGSLGMLLAIYSVLTPLACWRYEQAVMLPSTDKDAAVMLRLAATITCAMVIVSVVVILLAGQPLVNVVGRTTAADWLWVVPILISLAGAYQSLRMWLGRRRWFGSIAMGRVGRAGLSNALPIASALAVGASTATLIGGYLVGLGCEALVLLMRTWRGSRYVLTTRIDAHELRSASTRYRKFPLFAVPASLSNLLAIEAPTLLLATFFSPVEVGLYWLSYRVLALPTALAGEAVSTVFYQRMSAMRASGHNLAALTTQVTLLLLATAIVPMTLIAVTAPSVFAFVFGPAWEQAGQYARALVPAQLMLFVAYPLTQAFFIYEKQEAGLLWNIGFLATSVATFALGAALGGPLGAVQWYSIGSAVMYGLVAAMAFVWSGGHLSSVPAYVNQGLHELDRRRS